MPRSARRGAAGATPVRPPRRALVALCITQITSWGVLYYAFPVALSSILTDTGWSASSTTAAFSAGLVVSALVGIPVGRWLDRYGPRRVMTAGSLLAVPATIGVGLAPSLAWFLLAWLVAGAAMAAVFYQAAFAALTRWYGDRRVHALTLLTLVAGLSSTIFAPATSLLLAHLGWRDTYLALAAVLAVVTVPLHALALDAPWHPAGGTRAGRTSQRRAAVRAVARTREFVVLSAALTVTAFALYAASLTLIPLLTGRGLSPELAATTFGLLGAGQVLGRLGYSRLSARTSAAARTALVLGAAAVSLALLAGVPGPAGALIAVSVLTGAVRGAGTLLQATVVAEHWGTDDYGALSGLFAAPITLAAALAPWGGTALAQLTGSYPSMVGLLAGTVALATVLAASSGARASVPGRAGACGLAEP